MESSKEEVSRIIDETQRIENHKMDERKSQEIEKTCTENENQVLDDSSVASPVKHQKRKSGLIVKSEIKRIRSSDCIEKEVCQDKSLIDISSDEKLQLEISDVNSVSDCKSILNYTNPGEDIMTGSSNEFEKLSQKHKLDNADKVENKLMKSSGRKVKKELELSYMISLQMNKNATDMNKTETSNTSRSAEYTQTKEVLAERKAITLSALENKESHHRCIFGFPSSSPQKLSSITEFHPSNLIYEEPEFATSEYFQANSGFKNIPESFYQQQHSEENIKFENKIQEKRRISEKDDSSSSNGTDDDLTIYQQNMALRAAVKFLEHKGDNIAQTADELKLQLMEFVQNNPCLEIGCTESEKPIETKSIKTNKIADEETLEKSDKEVNPKVLTKNQRSPVTLFTTDNSTVIPPITENPKSPVISPTAENLKSPVTPLSPKYKESGNSSKTDDLMFKEYPGIAEEPTKVKKDARYQKRFYKQKPVKLPINWKINTDSSTEPEVNVEDDEKDKTQRSGEDPSSLPKDSEDSEPLIIHEKKQSQSHENDLPGTSESGMRDTDGYKLSSFMEESPTYSSTSDSVEENNELVPYTSKNICSYQVAEKWYQDAEKWLITHTSVASMQQRNSEISLSQNSSNIFQNDIKTLTWTIVKYNTRNISDGNCIFIRDITNIYPLDNSLTRPVRLKPYFKVICYAEDRDDDQEFCIEEILKMFLECQEEVLIKDPRLEPPSFEVPLHQVPLKISISLIPDDDYELVGDYLMRIV